MERLALLVGLNPLSNYLAAMVLRPSEVVLLYSPETGEPLERLRAVFEKNAIQLTEVCIDDATDVRKIRAACRSLQLDH